MSEKKKYANLQELAEAFRSSELSRDDWALQLDNDCSYLVWRGKVPFPEDTDAYEEFMDAKNEEAETWRTACR